MLPLLAKQTELCLFFIRIKTSQSITDFVLIVILSSSFQYLDSLDLSRGYTSCSLSDNDEGVVTEVSQCTSAASTNHDKILMLVYASIDL
jgi:hypothetical protein